MVIDAIDQWQKNYRSLSASVNVVN